MSKKDETNNNVAQFPVEVSAGQSVKFTGAEAQTIFEMFSNLTIKLGDPNAAVALATFESIKNKLPYLSDLSGVAQAG